MSFEVVEYILIFLYLCGLVRFFRVCCGATRTRNISIPCTCEILCNIDQVQLVDPRTSGEQRRQFLRLVVRDDNNFNIRCMHELQHEIIQLYWCVAYPVWSWIHCETEKNVIFISVIVRSLIEKLVHFILNFFSTNVFRFLIQLSTWQTLCSWVKCGSKVLSIFRHSLTLYTLLFQSFRSWLPLN